MKVKQLIKKLLDCDMNDDIYISAINKKNECDDNHVVAEVIQVEGTRGMFWIRNYRQRKVKQK